MSSNDIETLRQIGDWDGQGVLVRHDPPTGTWIFVCLHDTTLGRATGGTRMKVYPRLADAVLDGQRLAAGMTHKWAGLGMPYGGGKAVLAIPEPLEEGARNGLLERYGRLLHSLRGAFATGPDLGTSARDLGHIAQHTEWVLGIAPDGTSIDPGPYTALGVRVAIDAAVGHLDDRTGVAGTRVLIQGLGGVGGPLARSLAEDGATLLLSDLDAERLRTFATELGAEAIEPAAVTATACDVYAPCAVGATVTAETIGALGCRAVVGSANNQLGEAADADRLADRDILYVPDYIANAGGAMAFALMRDGLHDRDALKAKVATIGPTVTTLLDEARSAAITPAEASRRQVARRLRGS